LFGWLVGSVGPHPHLTYCRNHQVDVCIIAGTTGVEVQERKKK
jgi:hypothetical protein